MTRLLPSGRRLLLLDAILAIWVAGWIWAGIAVGDQVQGLEDVSTTLVRSGQAISSVGGVLGDFANLPLVGGRIGSAVQQVEAAGHSAVVSGRQSRSSIEELGTLLSLAVAIIPSVPLLVLYLPLRLLRWRERAVLRRALAGPGGPNRAVLRLLAERALANVPYDELRRAARDPWSELSAGRYETLAAAELNRLGLRLEPGPHPAQD